MKLEKLLDSSPTAHSGCGPLRGTHGRAHILVRLGRALLVAAAGAELGGLRAPPDPSQATHQTQLCICCHTLVIISTVLICCHM